MESLEVAQLDRIKIQKGFETLASALREQILSGEIQAGEVLPNERTLCELSGLSRGSVREALRVLEAQGLVTTRLGRNGGRVAMKADNESVRISLDHLIRGHQVPFQILLETVEALEPSLAHMAALHCNEQDVLNLQKASKKLSVASSQSRFLAANGLWHSAMAHASHNPILIAIHDALGPGLLHPHVAGFASAEIRQAVVHAVSRIEAAIIARDAATAKRRMERHVLAYRAQAEAVAPKIVTL